MMGPLRWRVVAAAIALGLLVAACQAELPEPQSPGARLYRAQCDTGCHRLFQPGSMTAAMWEIQVERKQREFRRTGRRPLTDAQVAVLLAYLSRHSFGASPDASSNGGRAEQVPGQRRD